MELKTIGLTKKFGSKTAVNALNITLTNGVYGLLGANGAGKTTLMRLLCNIQTPMQQLDAAMLREFIDRIEVSHTDKKSKTREITIVYNFIGAFDFERAKEKAQNTTQKQQRTA